MSDFFSDDFTAELKGYFLDSLIVECEKYIDLVDESLWKRIRSEVIEQSSAWAVDAKTNEFIYLTTWLENLSDKTVNLQNAAELIKVIKALKSYAEALRVEKTDSAELLTRFSLVAQNRAEMQFLHCRWGAQDFAVPLLSVVEISSQLPLYLLPEKRPGLQGVIPFRGEAVPVVSFSDFGFAAMENQNTYYVICEHEGHRFSLEVTQTEDLVSLRESELQSIEGQTSMIQASCVSQFFIKNEKSVMILDLEKLVA